MNCKYHKDIEAKYICEKCRQPVCGECITDVGGRKVCKSCVQTVLFDLPRPVAEKRLWGEFLFFCFSMMPGAAHMSLGLLRRGLQLMVSFIGAFFILGYARFESLIPLLVIPIWFYSFFDGYHTRKKIENGEPQEDNSNFDFSFLLQNKKYLGIGLIVFGLLGLLNSLEYSFVHFLRVLHLSNIYDIVRGSIFPVILIFIGFIMMRKAKKEISEPVIQQTEDLQ